MEDYKLSQIMSTDVLSVASNAPLNEISNLMCKQKYSCLLVVENKKPIGIITERDIVCFLSEQLTSGFNDELPVAADLMSGNLVLLQEKQSVLAGLVICIANKIRHLPIINSKGLLTGIVTYTDIANFQRSVMESQATIIEKSIAERTSELIKANQRLKEMTLVDPLLGIGNRRAMEIDIECTHDMSERYKNNYAIAMLDIDNFKLYNDHYGHQAGDNALQEVTNSVKATLRKSDRVYRYGGEELLILLPGIDADGAEELAKRILSELESKKIPHCKSSFDFVTASCGLGIYNNNSQQQLREWSQVVKSADEALYNAKNSGRNKVIKS